MTALDPFTAASGHYADAVRSYRPFKEGSAIQVMPSRIRWGRWPAAVGIGAFFGISALGLNADLVTSCAVGVMAGGAVLISDGWRAR